MKITTENSSARIDRSFTITEDQPVVPMAYSRNDKKVRISRGTITYRWTDGAWTVKDSYGVDLVGTVLKKDGSDSMNDHRRNPEDHWSTSAAADLADKLTDDFQWLAPIINLLRPTGDVAMMMLNETEVNG